MTVSELIEHLKEMPQDSQVLLNIKIRDDIYPNLKMDISITAGTVFKQEYGSAAFERNVVIQGVDE